MGTVTSHCGACGGQVEDGPEGGYVCGNCGHVVEPPGRVRERHARVRERRGRERQR